MIPKPTLLGLGFLAFFLSGLFIGLDYQKKNQAAERLALEQANAKLLAQKQNQILEVEQAWLNDDEQTKIIYKDRIKTVTKTVKEYVHDNHLEHCVLDVNGLQLVNQALSNASHTK